MTVSDDRRKYPSPRPTLVDFFCGAGGMSLGFEQAGFEVLLGVDRDGHHIATHERNFPYGKSICASVVELDGEQVKELVGGREIDLVIGGPPCQGFSHMGLRDLSDPRNSLIDHFVRLVLELKPKTFVMENVPGLLSGKTREILDAVVRTTKSAGYEIATPVRVLDAADFGVPQRRRRLFVVGVRSDVGRQFRYPIGPGDGQPERPTVIEAIHDLPEVEQYDSLLRVDEIQFERKPESTYAAVARGKLQDRSDLAYPREWKENVCTGCLRTKHKLKTVELYAATSPGETVPGHKLPRLAPNGLAPTLRAGSDSSHGSYTAPRPVHPIVPRCITAREAARLHGFPDWFGFYPLKWHAYRQIGNAVCPPVARAIGRCIVEVLGVRHTTRHPQSVSLNGSFLLPQDRPRTLKRVPVVEEFPSIVEFLFQEAYCPKSKKLLRARFAFSDVRRAIEATNSNLHWVREDTFLPEIARSRRVRDILFPCLSRGFSILPCSENGALGEFVPSGTAGTIDDRDSLTIRIAEIHDAVQLSVAPIKFNGDLAGVARLFTTPEFVHAIWGPTARVSITEDGARSPDFAFTLQSSVRAKRRKWVGVACRAGNLPTKTRIAELAESRRVDDALLVVSATSRHVVTVRFAKCRTHPREAQRTAFEYRG